MHYILSTRLYKDSNEWRRPRMAISRRSPLAALLNLLMAGAIITLFSLVLMIESAHAAPGEQATPEQLIEQTTGQMLNALQQQREEIKQHPQQIYTLANEIVLPHFDMPRMSAWVLGKHWRKASPQQKQQFPNEFRKLLIRTYGTAMAEYTDEEIHVLPRRGELDKDDSVVRTEIRRSSGPAIAVDYRLHNTGAGWKVYDINIEGISLLNNYRSNFSREVRRNGLDGLMEKLSSRNTQVASK